MKPDKYQKRCLETWLDDKSPLRDHWAHMAMGLASEAGEFVALVDKQIYKPSKQVTRAMLIDELGDVWYNLVIAASLLGITIEELDAANAEKLKGGHGWTIKPLRPEGIPHKCKFCGLEPLEIIEGITHVTCCPEGETAYRKYLDE